MGSTLARMSRESCSFAQPIDLTPRCLACNVIRFNE